MDQTIQYLSTDKKTKIEIVGEFRSSLEAYKQIAKMLNLDMRGFGEFSEISIELHKRIKGEIHFKSCQLSCELSL